VFDGLPDLESLDAEVFLEIQLLTYSLKHLQMEVDLAVSNTSSSGSVLESRTGSGTVPS
jgi:hypothetical protein